MTQAGCLVINAFKPRDRRPSCSPHLLEVLDKWKSLIGLREQQRRDDQARFFALIRIEVKGDSTQYSKLMVQVRRKYTVRRV